MSLPPNPLRIYRTLRGATDNGRWFCLVFSASVWIQYPYMRLRHGQPKYDLGQAVAIAKAEKD